jgi:nucleotide-binding universal stress UspA family protein
MTYATVMVSLALDQPNDARLEAVGQIAERFGAAVIGIAASQFTPPLYFTSGEQAQYLIDQWQAAIRTRLSELEIKFCAAMNQRSARAEWRSAIDDVIASWVVPDLHEGRDATAQLDAIAADVGAGIIVAGAYGHSRFREFVLGGMTQI